MPHQVTIPLQERVLTSKVKASWDLLIWKQGWVSLCFGSIAVTLWLWWPRKDVREAIHLWMISFIGLIAQKGWTQTSFWASQSPSSGLGETPKEGYYDTLVSVSQAAVGLVKDITHQKSCYVPMSFWLSPISQDTRADPQSCKRGGNWQRSSISECPSLAWSKIVLGSCLYWI